MSKLVPMDPAETGGAYAFDAGRPEDWFPRLGEFYWVLCNEPSDYSRDRGTYRQIEDGTWQWFACVMHIGSNYVQMESPKMDGGSSTQRIHYDDLELYLTRVEDPEGHIQSQIGRYNAEVKMLMGEVQEVTKRLGVVPHTEIADQTGVGDNSLAVLNAQVDTTGYKNALVKAKDEDLPALFKKIEHSNKMLAGWMCAPTLPTMASIGPMKKSIDRIEDRIYTIELYAGLAEEAVKVCDGDPAARAEPLRIMQRRLYMDEECLADYRAGGMDIGDLSGFDKFISEPAQRDRLLPFPRCLVAFRVRRYDKEREDGGNMMQVYVNASVKEADKRTFLYVRNGEQIWRVDCDFVFDEMIVPNRDEFDPSGEMYVKGATSYKHRDTDFMSKQRFESLSVVYAKHKAWMAEHDRKPKLDKDGNRMANMVYWSGDSPYYEELAGFSPSEWHPFNDTSVYFDEANEAMDKMVKRYNRVATIVQGLFDRSLVLHPHNPVRMWDPASFNASVELIYDSMTLTHGDKPDFKAYQAALNASIDENSILAGQEDYWMRVEAERENERQRNNWRDRHRTSNYRRLRPYGNPGPGVVSRPSEWKPRAKKAVFRWPMPVEDYWNRSAGATKNKVVEVPVDELLNVSAYQPGDFKRFFADPRTRREYLRWAPLMLSAEDYLAGKLKLGEPGAKGNDWD